MGNIAGVEASINLLQSSYNNTVTMGEAARAQDFLMIVDGYDKLVWLVQAATTPAIKREVVETVGPYGVRSIQQGRFVNEIEMAVTFKEVVSGEAYKALAIWNRDKEYKDVTLTLRSESVPTDTEETTWLITDCWIELDGADLSVEDAVPLKLSGTLHGSYFPSTL